MKDKNKRVKFIIGCVLTGLVFIMMLSGIFYTPFDPMEMDPSTKLMGPTLSHIFGCDNFGRDIFSRVMVGVRETMLVAGSVVIIGTLVGTIVGTITGYYGGWLDEIIMRLNDAVLAFPSVLLALLIIGLLGGGRNPLILALGIAFVPSFARIVRGEVLRIRNLVVSVFQISGIFVLCQHVQEVLADDLGVDIHEQTVFTFSYEIPAVVISLIRVNAVVFENLIQSL